jgi:ribonuclease HI
MFSPVIKLPVASILDKKSKYKTDLVVANTDVSVYKLYFDGCCKGNPGPGGAGAVLYKDDQEIWAESVFVGKRVTNNQAEYTGLILGLNYVINQPQITTLLIKGDSQLVIKQMRGEYKVNSAVLIELHNTVKSLAGYLKDIEYEHVYRKDNKRADALSNEGLLKTTNENLIS